jgi:4-amino-4-deoxy-L-arabinose transferase-like glycosyltransferase
VSRRGAGWWEISAVGAAALLGLALRLDRYRSVPFTAPNPDEWNWAWAGLSQLLGMPSTGWSLFWQAYPAAVRAAPPPPFNEPLVHPYIDAPPLFTWLVGAVAWLDGDRSLADVLHDPGPRLLGIALSIVALVLAYLLGRLVLGVLPAVIGLWLMATSPIPVVLDRLVAAEQLLAVLLLAALLAVFHLRREPGNRHWLGLLLACCLVAPGVKTPGLVVGVSAMLLFGARRQFRLALLAGGAALLGEVAVLAYTASLDWHSYAGEVRIRARQLSGLTAYRFITNTTGFDGQQAFDGWWLLGWLGLAEVIGRRRGDWDLLTVPAIVYLLLMLGLAAEYSSGYGWYRITLIPIVYLAAGRFLWLAAWELSWPRLALAAALAIATAANWAVPLSIKFDPMLLGGLVLLAVLPALVAMVRPETRSWARSGAFALLVALVPVSLVEVANLPAIYGHF